MIERERIYDHWFAFHAGLTGKKKRELLLFGKTPEQIYHFTYADCRQFFYENEIKRFKETCTLESSKRDIDWLDRNHGWTVFWNEDLYPEKLKQICDYPLGLCVKGKLPVDNRLSIAIVGSRDMSPYGQQAASFFSQELAKSGVQIISGLARGIDGCSHDAALKVGGYTLGVLGCGIDVQYPKSNQYLYEQIEARGGIISEFPIGTTPQPYLFPIRNRIISGISDGVFVIEAKERSGSLITADYALEQNRDVFALTARYYDDLSYGCLNLIEHGAKPVYRLENITEEYKNNYEFCTKLTNSKNFSLAKKEKLVYDCLRLEPKGIDQIVAECKLSVGEVLTILTMLELKQYIIQTQNNYYRIKE
ncbi:MAG: DNA-processing protein DprA [Lachnospiraceae bacterium]|nr:DNA-processing protein DprA [Lachnospiraceae bacterium]